MLDESVVEVWADGYSDQDGTLRSLARHNGTAPIEASSGPKKRHRLNPRGDRQLNHAIHMAAVTQISHNTPGRVYYLRKQAEGKTRKEAMRSLKRCISRRLPPAPTRLFGTVTPEPDNQPNPRSPEYLQFWRDALL